MEFEVGCVFRGTLNQDMVRLGCLGQVYRWNLIGFLSGAFGIMMYKYEIAWNGDN